MNPEGRASLCVFVSGTGRTLANLIARCHDGSLPARIGLVVASRECPALGIARDAGIEARVEAGELSADRLVKLLDDRFDWVVLAGYLKLLPVPTGWEGRIVNIHPALLPGFGGAGMYGMRVHRAVLESGAATSGCTVHLCDSAYDTGEIIEQRTCTVEPGDTPESLAQRVFELELEAYPAALKRLIDGRPAVPASRGSEDRA